MSNIKYDVFISYRRSDGIFPAYLLYRNLVDHYYLTFFDKKSVGGGPFPPQIEKAINECKDYVLLVTPDTFSKRIFKNDDWMRKEISIALSRPDINILVIFTKEIAWPKKLPKEIEAIKNCQAETIKDAIDIDEAEALLFQKYFKSEPKPAGSRYESRCSIYDIDFGNEIERLKDQGSKYDAENHKILDQYLKGNNYTVLDVGCAQGFVTQKAFKDARFSQVIGVDINKNAVKEANAKIKNKKFSFFDLDVESEDFLENMQIIMKEKNIKGFDVISCFLILHHLRDPEGLLRKLRTLLNKKGMIIIRGSDDGSKISYGDDGLIAKIVEASYKVPGISDRTNGRKLFTWLVDTGFKDVRVHSQVTDTSDMSFEEKQGLYNVSFAYRINYFKKQLILNDSEESLKDFNKMEEMLTKLQSVFARNDFWYALNSYVCVGFKK